eukprot:TRINITY_DN32445_c0_g1_i1.p1 TRINITY_DN32445_c0_g1~~TRINITY_DN32445_c0_g1_i1.p1  ORF type:complete len:151 (+),score=21.59 TRINITY_DN32445_c0_g1_i1:65-454(+)
MDSTVTDMDRNLKDIMLKAAAQAICDAGGAMGAQPEAVEQALEAQLRTSGMDGLSELTLLSGDLPDSSHKSAIHVGEAGAGPIWTLRVGSSTGNAGDCSMGTQAFLLPPGSLVPQVSCLTMKRRRVSSV